MIKIFLLFLCLSLLNLEARENPFFPSEGELDTPLSVNQTENYSPLKRVTLSLPSTARVIKGVTVSYQNLDGYISKKTIKLENSIDWHLPLFISQSYAPTQKSLKPKKKEFQKIFSLSYISLFETKKELKILTPDVLIRNFLLTKPHRIVCDFRRDIDIRAYEKKINDAKSVITKVRIGNHDGYYRLVIELDGYYLYNLQKIEGGYLLKFL